MLHFLLNLVFHVFHVFQVFQLSNCVRNPPIFEWQALEHQPFPEVFRCATFAAQFRADA